MDISSQVLEKIKQYHPKGGLDHTAKLVLALTGIKHQLVKEHIERVALLAEAVAIELKKDVRATFFAGLLHDIGKLILPYYLFDGRDISQEEYEEVKQHALAGFESLAGFHHFIALCAGLHHNLYKRGYGLTVEDFNDNWSPATIKKVLEISAIVSICDFIDAFTHRQTKIKDGSEPSGVSLQDRLLEKYPDDQLTITTALAVSQRLKL
jgi:putative nucleotidyltransferase with HDIG domain